MIMLTWLPLTYLPLAGQTVAGSKPAVAGVYEKKQPAGEAVLQRGERPANSPMQLRAGERAWPDSTVMYAADGERLSKSAFKYNAAGNQTFSANYVWQNGEWVGLYKEEMEHDAAGNVTSNTSYEWQNGEWVNSIKYEFAYDNDGNRTLYTMYHGENGAWAGSVKHTTEYDAGGQQISSVTYSWNNGRWVKNLENSYDRRNVNFKIRLRTEIIYNEDGSSIRYKSFVIESGDFAWSSPNSTEEEQMEYTPAYDASNNLTQVEVTLLRDGTRVPTRKCVLTYSDGNSVSIQVYGYNGNAVGEMIYKAENTYDADANLTKSESFEWLGDKWIGRGRVFHEYDANGNEIVSANYNWDSSANDWVGSSRYEHRYDAGGNEIFSANYDWDASTNDWAATSKYEHEYDANGYMSSYTSYHWDSSANGWAKSSEYEYEYDAGGRLLFEVSYNYTPAGEPASGHKTTCEEKNQNDYPIRYKLESWRNGEWIYDNYVIIYYPGAGNPDATQWVPGNTETPAYISGGLLHIYTARATQITIYTAGGVRVYAGHVQAGTTTLPAGNLPKGVLIIRSDSGWTAKVIL